MPASAPATSRRERIVARLAAAARHPVTLVLAAAGWGKSVALRHYLAGIEEPLVRFGLRPEHGTLLAFTRGFADALAEIAPQARGGVADAVASASSAASPGTALAQWMALLLSEFHGVVVLDDFHVTESDENCARFLTETIALTKSRIRWIVASRSACHLPVSSWLVYGDAGVPVGENDLRFTVEEAREAASAVHPGSDERDVDRLLDATGGWTTAFDLALRAPEYPADVRHAAETARKISYQYLAEQVFGTLSVQERSILLLGATLPDIDVDVLENAGFDRARDVLAKLQRRVTFLSVAPAAASEASPRGYLCHDLFRDFLERALDLQGEEAANAVRLRAASALRDCGRPVPALQLFARVCAAEEMIELLRHHGFDLPQRGHVDAFDAALDVLVRTSHGARPVVQGLLAYREALGGRYDAAVPLYERALAASDDLDLSALLTARLGLASINAGKNPEVLLESAASRRELGAGPRGELLSLLAMAYGRFDRFEKLTVPLLDEIETLARATDSPTSRATILGRLGIAAYVSGDAERSARALAQAGEIALADGRFRMAAITYTNSSENFVFNADDLSAARGSIDLAIDSAVKSGDAYILRFVVARRMAQAVARGDREAAQADLEAYDAQGGPKKLIDTILVRGALAAWEGRFDAAYRAYDEGYSLLWLQEDRIVAKGLCALFAAAAGERQRALACVAEALAGTADRRSPRPTFERHANVAHSLCALARALAGQRAAAERLLRRAPVSGNASASAFRAAVTIVVRNVDGAIDRSELRQHFETLNRNHHGGYVRILEAILDSLERGSPQAVSLTPAETAVLRSLAAGKTPKEVAEAAGCTIHTVRWHIRQCISKFGCSGSDQAVRAARSRGLL